MTIEPTTRLKPPIGMIIVLALAALLYAGMMANIGEIQNPMGDAAGRGMAAGFAMVLLMVEWVLLAVLLLIGGINGDMPNWAAIAAALLWPLSG
ncbi:MAG TPA: hypothetical protein VK432_10010, partial [Stellaceae bacterium]|nr:hypothetical protein [Stellaceae bacterium]